MSLANKSHHRQSLVTLIRQAAKSTLFSFGLQRLGKRRRLIHCKDQFFAAKYFRLCCTVGGCREPTGMALQVETGRQTRKKWCVELVVLLAVRLPVR